MRQRNMLVPQSAVKNAKRIRSTTRPSSLVAVRATAGRVQIEMKMVSMNVIRLRTEYRSELPARPFMDAA